MKGDKDMIPLSHDKIVMRIDLLKRVEMLEHGIHKLLQMGFTKNQLTEIFGVSSDTLKRHSVAFTSLKKS